MKADALFWAKVDTSGDCWEWQGVLTVLGYGYLRRNGQTWRTHRYAWMLTSGPIPQALHVLHRCDNRRCVRPDHLWLGTHADNMADMAAKHRTAFESCPESAPRGEGHWNAKLTAELVRSIRQRAASGEALAAIASEYGVGRKTVSDAVLRRTWAHI